MTSASDAFGAGQLRLRQRRHDVERPAVSLITNADDDAASAVVANKVGEVSGVVELGRAFLPDVCD